MDLLKDVEGDGDNTACVLAYSDTSEERHGTDKPSMDSTHRTRQEEHIQGTGHLPRPRLVWLEEDEEGGFVVPVQELEVYNVQQLLI